MGKYNTIPFDEMPDAWRDRCSGDGHMRETDSDGNKRYVGSQMDIDEEGYRACAKCGEFPNEYGDDHCIQRLGKVINACCGHGKNKGYIMFDDGTLIEGYFEIKNLWKQSNLNVSSNMVRK